MHKNLPDLIVCLLLIHQTSRFQPKYLFGRSSLEVRGERSFCRSLHTQRSFLCLSGCASVCSSPAMFVYVRTSSIDGAHTQTGACAYLQPSGVHLSVRCSCTLCHTATNVCARMKRTGLIIVRMCMRLCMCF